MNVLFSLRNMPIMRLSERGRSPEDWSAAGATLSVIGNHQRKAFQGRACVQAMVCSLEEAARRGRGEFGSL